MRIYVSFNKDSKSLITIITIKDNWDFLGFLFNLRNQNINLYLQMELNK